MLKRVYGYCLCLVLINKFSPTFTQFFWFNSQLLESQGQYLQGQTAKGRLNTKLQAFTNSLVQILWPLQLSNTSKTSHLI